MTDLLNRNITIFCTFSAAELRARCGVLAGALEELHVDDDVIEAPPQVVGDASNDDPKRIEAAGFKIGVGDFRTRVGIQPNQIMPLLPAAERMHIAAYQRVNPNRETATIDRCDHIFSTFL